MKQKLHTFAQIPTTHCNPHIYDRTLKTRKKPTTDFVFDFSRVMSGQKMQISSRQKVCQRFHLIRQPIFLHVFFFYVEYLHLA